jgi:NADH-quinone oxidoreductase subunit A
MNPTSIVAYLALFAAVGLVFVFAALLIGRFVRAKVPTPSKLEIYECGETPIGPGFVQFDLRFYVVALLFIIFEVEVAFFFPWATVFGKATELRNPAHAAVVPGPEGAAMLSGEAVATLRQLGVPDPAVPTPTADVETNRVQLEQSARHLALTAMVDIAVFFGVLMLGFAYLWSRGDLRWVRASTSPALGEVVERSGHAAVGDRTFVKAVEQGKA